MSLAHPPSATLTRCHLLSATQDSDTGDTVPALEPFAVEKEIALLGSGCFVSFPSAVPFSLVTRDRLQTLPINPSGPILLPAALFLLPQPLRVGFPPGSLALGRAGVRE